MLYTIMPEEIIYQDLGYEKQFAYEEKEYLGQLVQVVRRNETQYQLVRVISTDPKIFLRAEFQPGTILNT